MTPHVWSTWHELWDADFCLRWTLMLGHFMWQGCVIGLFVAAGHRLLGRCSADLRYRLNVVAMLLMPACLPVTFAALVTATRSTSAAVDRGPSDGDNPPAVSYETQAITAQTRPG